MVAEQIYVVDFHDAFHRFKRVVGDPELPTIDADVIMYNVMSIFEQVEPLVHLHRIAADMVKDDYLYSKDEFFDVTPWDAAESDRFVRNYLREAIVDLGLAMYNQLRGLGLIRSGSERYQVTNRPLTDDTYLLKRTRP